MEGWLITFVYGPLLSILLTVPATLLKMTERKMSQFSRAFDLSAWRESGYLHDGLLRIEKNDQDVLAMEAKPTEEGSLYDFRKLGIVLSNDILAMKGRYPGIADDDHRAYGIMFVGYDAWLLETRLVGGKPLLFSVANVLIPRTTSDLRHLVHLLEMFIDFKRRVDGSVKLLLQHDEIHRAAVAAPADDTASVVGKQE